MNGFQINTPDTAMVRSIADKIGTPFYIYDADGIRLRYAALKREIPNVDFFYSLKANPNLGVVSVLVKCGMGCEVSSLLELETALVAGATADRILMVGPGKSDKELSRAVSLGIKAIVVESLFELRQVNVLAAASGNRQAVALRINPDFRTSGARLTMSGRASQFGIDQSQIKDAIELVEASAHLRLAGLHIYMGTRILDHETVASNTRQILSLAAQLQQELTTPLDFVDVGGGFGVPYYDGEDALNLAAVGDTVRPLIETFCSVHPATRVAIELGRYMVAEAGCFVTSVRQLKSNKGEYFAVCDGGSNVHGAAAGQGFMRRNFPVSLISLDPCDDISEICMTVTGPLCTPTDVIAKDVLLPTPHQGDLVCVHQSGAYGPTASPVNFLGFGSPAEVLRDNGQAILVRRRPAIEVQLADQRPEPLVEAVSLVKTSCFAGTSFDHPVLEKLEALRLLFERTGIRLETDPDAWTDLWGNSTVRALTTIGVPDEFNGFPLSVTELGIESCSHALHVAMIERLARFDASCILALPGPSLSGGAVLAVGQEDQIARFFDAYRHGPQGTFFAVTEPDVGSDARNGTTILRRDGYGAFRLDGSKMLVGGIARARIGLIFARVTETGRNALVMIEPEKHLDHISITRLPMSGLCGADLCRIDLKDLPVTTDMILSHTKEAVSLRDGFMAINGVFERNRPVVAALALGNGCGMLERLSVAGMKDRFAEFELRHAALINRLADTLADAENGHQRGHRISEIKMQAVAFSDDLVESILSRAPGLLLSDGLLRKKLRDSKAFEYMEGTSNIHILNTFRSYLAEVPA